MAAKETVQCTCSRYQVETPEGVVGTDCTSVTRKKFAPGHDAKLKSLLVQAGANGHSVRVTEEDGSVSVMGHSAAAKLHGMVEHVEKGIELFKQRLTKKDKPSDS